MTLRKPRTSRQKRCSVETPSVAVSVPTNCARRRATDRDPAGGTSAAGAPAVSRGHGLRSPDPCARPRYSAEVKPATGDAFHRAPCRAMRRCRSTDGVMELICLLTSGVVRSTPVAAR